MYIKILTDDKAFKTVQFSFDSSVKKSKLSLTKSIS